MMMFIGAGAVGTTLATLAAAAGREPVQLYTRDKDRAAFEALTQLRVDRHGGALCVPRPPLRSVLDLHDVDYLVIAVKHPQLTALLDALPPLPPGCTVVSTLNGLSATRQLRERLPGAPIVAVSVMFNAQWLAPLHTELTTRAHLVISGHDARLRRAFAAPGVAIDHARGERGVWGKLLINLANAVCALTHATFEDLFRAGDLRQVYAAVLDEAVGILRRTDTAFTLPMPVPYTLYRALLRGRSQLPWQVARRRNGLRERAYPSMMSDIAAGRPTEVDELNGEIVRHARAHGLDAPLNAALVDKVQALHGLQPPPYRSAAALRRELGV
ncbi:ketopantoate reductase family protein [Solimonas marina]|uniref:2-dehydropantoate 2-reductase n=1 Tax=Solimonas marina TaxID=2714601 RepID=A0A969WB36_9GAMM|nr:2-dehydropantoate 2-reductase [Solimonas marina]NKF23712.1 2-dehydropantoate 2-reductase [Solimonas marina]